MKNRNKNIFVISGPSGVGKSSLAEKLLARIDNLKKTTSYTTRNKRIDEIDGEDYYFIDKTEFERKIEKQEFIEWVSIYNNYYGTSYSLIGKMLADSDLLMVIDMDGARNIKKAYPENTILTYILPPGFEELEKRLFERSCDTPKEDLRKRLKAAKTEIERLNTGEIIYDYKVINDNLDDCFEKLRSFIAE